MFTDRQSLCCCDYDSSSTGNVWGGCNLISHEIQEIPMASGYIPETRPSE